MRRPVAGARALLAGAVPFGGFENAAFGAIPRRAGALAALLLMTLGVPACTPGPPPKVMSSVVTANMVNAADVDGLPWKDRIDRFSAAISANGPAPDIISMTESAGPWHCWVAPFRQAEDCVLVDRLISNLETSTGVRYRTQATIFVSIVGAGLPVAISYGAMGLEFSMAQLVRAAWRYWRAPRRFLAGGGHPTGGYLVLADPLMRTPTTDAPAHQQGEPLWDA